jgi:hypothetical protein
MGHPHPKDTQHPCELRGGPDIKSTKSKGQICGSVECSKGCNVQGEASACIRVTLIIQKSDVHLSTSSFVLVAMVT